MNFWLQQVFDCNRIFYCNRIFWANFLIIRSASFPIQGIIRAEKVSVEFPSLLCSSIDPFGIFLDHTGRRRIHCHSYFFIVQLWLHLVLFSELFKDVLWEYGPKRFLLSASAGLKHGFDQFFSSGCGFPFFHKDPILLHTYKHTTESQCIVRRGTEELGLVDDGKKDSSTRKTPLSPMLNRTGVLQGATWKRSSGGSTETNNKVKRMKSHCFSHWENKLFSYQF